MDAEHSEANAIQEKYARLAGFLFLFVIALAFAGGYLTSRIAG